MDYKHTNVDTAVAILNYNGIRPLQLCLPSVVEHSTEAVIYIIDNASTDDSIAWVQKHYPSIKIIKLNHNLGFTGGYNEGLRHIQETNCVLLNSDVEVTKGWMDAPLFLLKNNSSIGAVQPTILDYYHRNQFEYAGAAGGYIDRLGIPFCKGRLFHTIENDEGQYALESNIFWASGACMFIRTSVFFEVGGFDSDYFAHMEEIDLCWRMHRSGYSILYTPGSTVYHIGGATLHKSNPKKLYLNVRNSLWTIHKNVHPKLLLKTLILRLCLDGLAGIQFFLLGKWSSTWAIIKGHIHFYFKRNKMELRNRYSHLPYLTPSAIGGYKNVHIAFAYFVKKRKKFSEVF